jgi:deoxyribonuclease V
MPDVDLHEEVDELVSQVPEGMVTTYGRVAIALGDIAASRFVGKVMSENDDIVRVPCRRVVQSDGTLGGYTGGGASAKRKVLRAEGIRIEGDRIVDFERILFYDFKTKHPLKEFRKIQLKDSKRMILDDDFPAEGEIAGSDIAYIGEEAFGALVVFDRGSLAPKEVITVRAKAKFPYIPTYLTFREAPIVDLLVKKHGGKPLLVCDGNGIIHPLGFGVASHIGVMLDMPTIGVAKKLLCGRVIGSGMTRRVLIGRMHAGYAVSGGEGGSPVYVSPGNRISVASAMKVLRPYWKYRLPEPARLSHIEAERYRRGDSG